MLAEDFLKEIKQVDPKGRLAFVLEDYKPETIQKIASQYESVYEFIMEIEQLCGLDINN